jgi:hypothetical protein
MTIQRKFFNISRLAVAAAAFAVVLPTAGLAQYSSPIHDVDNSARQPVQFPITLNGLDGSVNISGSAYQVPAGKRLVIEQITGSVSLPTPLFVTCFVFVTSGGNTTRHFLRFDPPIIDNSFGNFYATLPVRIYADPGTNVVLGLARSGSSGAWTGFLTASGYLVNLP